MGEELERRAERIHHGLEVAPVQLTLQEAGPQYLHAVRQLRSLTSITSRWHKHILPALGERKLVELQARPALLEEFLVAKREEGLGQQSVRHLRVTLQAFFSWALNRAGLLTGANPVSKTTPIAVPEPTPKALTMEQVEAVAAKAATPLLRDFILAAAYTGLRKGELAGLRWEDYDGERHRLTVRRSYQGTTKTGRSRVVPVPPQLVPVLESRRRAARGQYVFSQEGGAPLAPDYDAAQGFKAALRAAGLVAGYEHVCRRCGHTETAPSAAQRRCPAGCMVLWPRALALPFSFKDLRSSYVTFMVERTGDMRAAQLLAGHGSMRTTERHYAATREQHLADQVAKAFTPQPSTDSKAPKEGR
jgi:integrase